MPPVPEQIEIIRRHVSDQYRLALYSSSLESISDLLLKTHELHSALGPVSSERYEGTPLVAIMDSGANISAVHPSTLEKCGISEDKVVPWNFNPVELAVSEHCLPSGLVWPQIQLLGRLFSHRLAVIPELSCPILLRTDFMIPACAYAPGDKESMAWGEQHVHSGAI
ncbi:hypothetical protein ABVT39_019851 [Epinephelus coioides]